MNIMNIDTKTRLWAEYEAAKYKEASEAFKYAVSHIHALRHSLLGEKPLCYANYDKSVLADHNTCRELLLNSPGSASSLVQHVKSHISHAPFDSHPTIESSELFPIFYQTASGKVSICITKDSDRWLVVIEARFYDPDTVASILSDFGFKVEITTQL